MRVFITGGAGFIGSHIAEFHLNKGDQVHIVDNFSSGSKDNIKGFINNPNFTFTEDDIVTWQHFDTAVNQADLIYHMAAVVGMFSVMKDPKKTLVTNIAGSERLLRAVVSAHKKPLIIMASSSEVYGQGNNHGHKESDPLIIESVETIRWNYSISKLVDEFFGLTYYHEYNIPVIIARFFNTIGIRQCAHYGMVVPRFVEQALTGKPITVFDDGQQSRCFCNVHDTVKILHQLSENPRAHGQIFNVGNDHEISILELAKLVKKLASSSSEINLIPYDKAYGKEYKDIRKRKPDLTKLRQYVDLDFKVSLEQSIRNLIEFYKPRKGG